MRHYILAVITVFSCAFAGWEDYFSPGSLVDGEGCTAPRLIGILQSCPESYGIDSVCLCAKAILDAFAQKTDDGKYDAEVLRILLDNLLEISVHDMSEDVFKIGEFRKAAVHSLLADPMITDYKGMLRALYAMKKYCEGEHKLLSGIPLRSHMLYIKLHKISQ